MDNLLLEQLLNENESSTLDFKRDQYTFDGATDDEKGELLKDILAFANSWRRTTAYILIGIEEVQGRRGLIHGVSNHLADNNLQQFVNAKTQKPLTFSYIAFPVGNVQIGIIEIPLQDRPIYLKQSFGKLKKETVYIRRGSSTSEATIDEISKMGVSNIVTSSPLPELDLEFGDSQSKELFGKDLNLSSTVIKYDKSEIKPIRRPYDMFPSARLWDENENYPIEMAEYIRRTSLISPLKFVMKNIGTCLASNVHLEINAENSDYLVLEDSDYPRKPTRRRMDSLMNLNLRDRFREPALIIENSQNTWSLEARFGNVKPGATVFCEQHFYMGSKQTCKIDLTAIVYADNLTKPLEFPLSISITSTEVGLDLDEIYN